MRVISWGPVFSQMTEAEILAYFEHCTGLEAEDYMEDYGGLYLDGGRPVLLFRRDSDVIGNCIEISVEVGTDITAFTEALLSALDMPDVDAGIFRIREFDPADEVYYMTGND